MKPSPSVLPFFCKLSGTVFAGKRIARKIILDCCIKLLWLSVSFPLLNSSFAFLIFQIANCIDFGGLHRISPIVKGNIAGIFANALQEPCHSASPLAFVKMLTFSSLYYLCCNFFKTIPKNKNRALSARFHFLLVSWARFELTTYRLAKLNRPTSGTARSTCPIYPSNV